MCHHRHGLPLRRRGEPRPGDDDGDRIGGRVEALAEELRELREIFRGWQEGVVDQLATLADAEPALRVDDLAVAVDRLEKRLAEHGGRLRQLEARGLCRAAVSHEQRLRKLEQPPPLGDVMGPLQNDPYLSQAVADWEEAGAGPQMAKMLGHLDRGCAKTFDAISARLRKLEHAPASPLVADDVTLDAQPSEPSHAALLQLWRRLSGPDAFDVHNPGALANVALTARAGAASLSEQLEALRRRYKPLEQLLEITTELQRRELRAFLHLANPEAESSHRLLADALEALDEPEVRHGHQ